MNDLTQGPAQTEAATGFDQVAAGSSSTVQSQPTVMAPEIWGKQTEGRNLIFIYLNVLLAISLTILVLVYVQDPSIQFLPFATDERIMKAYLTFFSAVCGGVLYCFQAFNWFHSETTLDVSKYWPWYLSHPLIAGVTGAFFYAIIKSNSLSLAITPGTGLLPLLAYSFLVGLFTQQVILKIKEIFQTVLVTREGAHNKPSGPSA